MFTFKVKAVGENADSAPKPDGVQPNEDGYFTVKNIGQNIAFGQATFNAGHVGIRTFTRSARSSLRVPPLITAGPSTA